MKINRFLLLVLIALPFIASAQRSAYTPAEKEAMDWLQERVIGFKKTKSDSLYVVKFSDRGFYRVSFNSGDQKEDIDKEIFSAKVGDVVGPFRGDSFCYLFKVASFSDTMPRAKAQIIEFKALEPLLKDYKVLNRYIDKYVDAIKDEKDIYKMALKEEDKLRLKKKELGWYWDNQKEKQYHQQVFEAKKGEPVVIKNEKGIYILNVIEERTLAPNKVTLIPIVRKIKTTQTEVIPVHTEEPHTESAPAPADPETGSEAIPAEQDKPAVTNQPSTEH